LNENRGTAAVPLEREKHGGAEPSVRREETTAAKSSSETAPLSTRKLLEKICPNPRTETM
jgi:hypothetical protein